MKNLIFLVLGLLLSSCYSPADEDDMGRNKYGQSGGWSATGTMTNDGISKAAHLQVNFLETESTPNPSKNYTVQFSVGPTKNATTKALVTNVVVNPVAEIKWSVEGNDVRRLVTVTNGMSITGVGEAIKVSVQDQSGTHGPVVNYDVGITVAPGSRPSENQPATLSAQNPSTGRFIFIVPANNNQNIDIPQDAGVISAFITVLNVTDPTVPIPDGVAEVQLVDAALITQRAYDPRIGWVPVTPQANKIVFTNNFPAVYSIGLSVTFGIDG